MYQTINENDFIRAFEAIRPENFSRRALQELFQHLEGLEDDLGEQMELDPIAICCDWTEYTGEELLGEFGDQLDEEDDPLQAALELLDDDGGYILTVEHFETADTYLVQAN